MATLLVTCSLVVNIGVAGTMGAAILNPRSLPALRIDVVFGPDTPARRILACLYLAIAGVSGVALAHAPWRLAVVRVLFPLQIAYKVATAAVVSLASNPVPRWNLAIAALHMVSLAQAARL